MVCVKERMADGRVLALLESYLKAGVLEEMKGWQPTESGTPRGAVISPLLANVCPLRARHEMAAQEKYRQAQRTTAAARSAQQWPQPGSHHRPDQSHPAGLVWLLRVCESQHLLHLGWMGARAAAVDFAQAPQAPRPSARARSSTLAERLLWLRRALSTGNGWQEHRQSRV